MRSDVVVVGGGIVGLCSAWYLRKAGAEVTVLSRDPVPGGDASEGNAGMIVPSHVVPLSAPGAVSQGLRYLTSRTSPFYVKPRLDPEFIRWLWRFWRSCTDSHVAFAAPVLRDQSLESIRLLSELQGEIGDFGWEQTGLLMVYRSEKHREENLRAAELAESLGLRVRRLDADRTLGLEPGLRPETQGSVLYEDDGRVDPSALLARLRAALSANGVIQRDGVCVAALRRNSGSRVEIRLVDGERVDCSAVVLAAGAWTGELAATLGVRVPVQPAKGYSLTF
ncbi:MAG: FAD-dependent oxidoreductase, partial [Longimicrobiales bacterium]|nr:FAD-dependent oxidoreductase [Longimicrobiales bacterium]